MNFKSATYTCLLMTNINCIWSYFSFKWWAYNIKFSVISIQEWYIHNKYPAAKAKKKKLLYWCNPTDPKIKPDPTFKKKTTTTTTKKDKKMTDRS